MRYRHSLSLVFALSLGMMAAPAQPVEAGSHTLRLATTTSTANSGLLKILLPEFEADTGIKVLTTAVGTGKALRLGRSGRADVLLVHAPEAEEEFVASGYGLARHKVMHNDFVVAGPKEDPAGIRNLDDVAEAFRRIAATQSGFISRADDSGTHKKELQLWEAAQVEPFGPWYFETGQGMKGALEVADRRDSYILADHATWLALRRNLPLVLLVEGDERLFNPYGVIAVNPEKHPGVNRQNARIFIDWITSGKAREMIRAFRVEGEALFTPATDTE